MFYVKTTNKKVIMITNNLNEVYEELLTRVESLEGKPKVSDLTWAEIAKLMRAHHITGGTNVKAQRHWMRKVMGWFSGGLDIFLNTRALGRAESHIAETITHEDVHLVDRLSEHSFGHGDNKYASWKEETAPHKIGRMAMEIYEEKFGKQKLICRGRWFWRNCKWERI